MTELIRFSERRGNRPQNCENACVQFHGCRVLGAYSCLDVARRRTQEQIGGDLQLSAEIEASLQLSAEIEVSVSAFR